MKNSRIVPCIAAIVLFFALAAAYFAPQFAGKSLPMHDITQYEGMSHDIKVHNAATGDNTAWTGNSFSGMPSYMINFRSPGQLVKHTVEKIANAIGNPAAMLFLAMVCFWIMLLLWGVDVWVAMVAAVAYGFSTYSIIIIGAGHITKMWAMVFGPALVGAVVYVLRGGNVWLGSGLAALFASLEIGANHPQITYYFLLVIVALWINTLVESAKHKLWPQFAKRTVVLAVAAVLAVGSNFAPLYYTAQHTPDTTRGGSELGSSIEESDKGLDLQYATAWSYGRTESLNMFIPDLMGGSSEGGFKSDGAVAKSLAPYNARKMATTLPAYWGDQPMTAGPTYIGAVMLLLALLALFVLEGRRKWWIAAVSIVGLLLSWGSNMMWFTELCFKILPGYNKFRTVSMALVIVQWSVPVLAALVLSEMSRRQLSRPKLLNGLKWSTAICGGVALFFILFGKGLFQFSAPFDSQLPDDVVKAMQSERASMLRADSLRSLCLVLASALTIWLFAKDKIKKWVLIALLGVLVVVDMVPVDLRFLPQSKFTNTPKAYVQQPTAADNAILQDKELGYRVANMAVSTFNDATTSYYHRSVGGYHGAKMKRYQDLIDRYLSKGNIEIYNMLNTKYFIVPTEDQGQQVQVNPDANSAAWFVEGVDLTDGAEAEIEALGSIDNKHRAVVDSKFASQIAGNPFGEGSIELTEYAPNRLVYQYDSPSGGVAVFSEIYYPKGWKAYVDDSETPYFRADYTLRAMALPAGAHKVEFRFEAPNYKLVNTITLICSLLILAGVAAGVVIAIVKGKKGNDKIGQQVA